MGNLLPHRRRRAGCKPSTDSLAAEREAIELALQAEGSALTAVMQWLQQAKPLEQWPAVQRRALLAALTEEGEGTEAQKARWLRRHLFRDVDPGLPPLPASTLPAVERCIAERFRVDLIGLVPLGGGLKMLAVSNNQWC